MCIHLLQVNGLTGENDELKNTLGELETERDFYFDKLRQIEELCQTVEGVPVVADIMDIMYETQVRNQSSSLFKMRFCKEVVLFSEGPLSEVHCTVYAVSNMHYQHKW